jgi:histidine ammonia-lyase
MGVRLVKLCGVALAALVLGCGPLAAPAQAAAPVYAYQPITPSMAGQTVTLTGNDLTVEQLVQIARFGAKVQMTPAALQRANDHYGLLLQATAENVPVYWFNRGAGSEREVEIFHGSAMDPANKAMLEKANLEQFREGAAGGFPPEVVKEEIVRAMMAHRANAMTHDAPSPQLMKMLVDLINAGITPVVREGGTLGEGDLSLMGNIGAAMVGAGEVYYKGQRMPAAQALRSAGLAPIQPFAADVNALTSSNAYATAKAALAVYDAQRLLEWADLSYAIDLLGMNSSVTPMSLPVQSNRPFPWINYSSAKALDMVRGSYLWNDDPKRIIQDPESMRASPQRAGSAWLAWSRLRDTVLIQLNSSDHNPAARTELKPTDSWQLSTPQMMKFHVKGGPLSNGKSGYILSNANWDPYPMANDLEAFNIALANLGVVVAQRIERFSSPFFTVISPGDVMKPEQMRGARYGFGGYLSADLMQEIQANIHPVSPEGNAIVSTVEDIQAQTKIKTRRTEAMIDDMYKLMSIDLLTGAFWADVRKAQDPARQLGQGPTAAIAALRAKVPTDAVLPGGRNPIETAYEFIKTTPATTFYQSRIPMPAGSATPMGPTLQFLGPQQ